MLKSVHGLSHGLILQGAALEDKSVQTLLSWAVLLVLLEIPLSFVWHYQEVPSGELPVSLGFAFVTAKQGKIVSP